MYCGSMVTKIADLRKVPTGHSKHWSAKPM